MSDTFDYVLVCCLGFFFPLFLVIDEKLHYWSFTYEHTYSLFLVGGYFCILKGYLIFYSPFHVGISVAMSFVSFLVY